MKARTLAAATVAIAMATTGCAFFAHSDNQIACIKEALTANTSLPPEDAGRVAWAIVRGSLRLVGLERPSDWWDMGSFDPEECAGGYGRDVADHLTNDEWIGVAQQVRIRDDEESRRIAEAAAWRAWEQTLPK